MNLFLLYVRIPERFSRDAHEHHDCVPEMRCRITFTTRDSRLQSANWSIIDPERKHPPTIYAHASN